MITQSTLFSLANGGISHYTYCLADALTCHGVQANVLMYDYPAYELETLPHRHRVMPTIRMSHTKLARVADPLRNLKTLTAAARRSDVVHYQWAAGPRTDPWQWRTVKRLGKPVIYTAHDVKPHEGDIMSRDHSLWVYRNADALIVHGQRLRDTLLEMADVSPEKVHIVPHGNYNFVADLYQKWGRANARASFEFCEDDHVVLFFGMIRPYKGLDTLIDACGIVKKEHPSHGKRLRLLIAGKPLKNYWEDGGYPQLIVDAGLSQQTRCIVEHIPMEDIGRYFHAADVVAIPYKSGSQSGVLQLAYAFGKPSVVTNVGSFAEVLQDGVTGALVPPDDPAAFAGALAQLSTAPGLAARIGQQGRYYAETALSWDRIAAQTRAIYQQAKATQVNS